ncbi:MAG: transposase [Lachnospiraceae bacterium]|nr:transposase [Lachnospiraceae bacterium]
MGKQDTVTKDYLKNTKVFADAFNFFIYGGEPFIDGDKLHEMDPTAIGILQRPDGAGIPIQKYRDVLKCLTAMTDGNTAYLILGIEAQSYVHYAMPVKAELYDTLEYAGQVERTAQKHREEMKARKNKNTTKDKMQHLTSDEYLCGFWKEDRLIPVITLVIYFSPDDWDGPLSLHEMFSTQDEKILSLVPDYKLNFISPAAMSEEEIDKFQTSLREVMLYIKNSKDKKRLAAVVNGNDSFKSLDRKAAEVLRVLTNTNLIFSDDKEETCNMCKALDDMCADAREDGIETATFNGIKNIMESFGVSAEKAMTVLKVPKEDFPKYLTRLQKQ